MGSFAKNCVSLANGMLRPLGCQLIPSWRLQRHGTVDSKECFELAGIRYPYFVHQHNCGWPPPVATERTVELSVADYWLERANPGQVIEVGAVTSYYWPRRVNRIVDPVDPIRYVTDRKTMSDVDLRGHSVLSISTLEHIGKNDYGLPDRPELLHEGVQQLVAQADQFLVTVPLGYNPHMDKLLADPSIFHGARVTYMVRQVDGSGWQEESRPNRLRAAYGPTANTIAIIERGGIVLPG